MIDINELRRLAQAATPGPDGVSLSWVRLLRDFQQGASPATISELLDRLEAAEKSDAESLAMYRRARDEREALRTKAETAENDAAHQKALADSALRVAEGWERKCGEMRAALQHETDCVEAAKAEIAALRAKIEAMERQKPAYWGPKHAIDGGSTTVIVGRFPVNPTDAPLYAIPGAKGE